MNTFFPHPELDVAAKMIPNKQLGKQRLECCQLLRVLRGTRNGYKFHPATLMWEGCENALVHYLNAICNEWKSRGFEDNSTVKNIVHELFGGVYPRFSVKWPWWRGIPCFHESNRLVLEWKSLADPAIEKPDYIWPVASHRWRLTSSGRVEILRSKWSLLEPVSLITHDNAPFALTGPISVGQNTARYLLQTAKSSVELEQLPQGMIDHHGKASSRPGPSKADSVA